MGAAVITLLAATWGGATERMGQTVALAGLGLLWLFAPARRWPDRGFLICAGGLILLAAMAWSPANWFAEPSWRRGLEVIGIPLSATLSPQPWLSAEGFLWLLVGLAWLAWLLGQSWDSAARVLAARVLAGGLVLLAVVALVAWVAHIQVPGWRSARGFGPFPNRNHTGHVLALGGVLALGCAADAGRRRWPPAAPWVAGAAILLLALVANYSRGGLLLFFGALVVWAALESWQQRSWKILAVGASLVLVLGSVVLVAGGAFAARFAGGADSQVVFRAWIWRDTLALIHASPWCGAGLENFQALFPLFRSASVNQQSVLHPESDWLWLASELGWLGVAFAWGAAFFVLRPAVPFAPGTRRRLRGAAFAGALAALLHGAIDVPGHRLGAALLALLVMTLARGDDPPRADSRAVALGWRLLGLLALGTAFAFARLPDEAARADRLLPQEHFAEAEAAANRALQRAPLDWGMYFTRAGARAGQGRTLEALADFRRARLLEPHYAGLPFEEGRFWLPTQPMLALNVWREALRRVPSPDDGSLYGAMLAAAPNNADFRLALLALAQGRPALQVQWLQFVAPEEGRPQAAKIAAAVRQASPEVQAAFQHRAKEIGAPVAP